MVTKYGVMSDFHSIGFNIMPVAIEVLKKKGIDALVLNGDLFGERYDKVDSQTYLSNLLKAAGKSNLETYVLPGSHEEVHIFEPVLAAICQEFPNVIDTFKNPHIDKKDHHLAFLQGSDWRAGSAVNHGYSLETEHNSGTYSNEGAYIRVVNMKDLEKSLKAPEKTLLFSHVPRAFDNKESSVDMAEFWETQEQFRLGNDVVGVGSIFPGPVGYHLKQQGAPIRFRNENRGNQELKGVYQGLGVVKNITGHFHESAGRANDLSSQAVEEGKPTQQLFYNASCMDRFMAGIVTVDGVNASYENVNLKDYITIKPK